MAADELLIMNLIPFCQQHVTQVTRRFQNLAAATFTVEFKRSHRQIETQWQLRTREELLSHDVAFGHNVSSAVATASARLRTTRTADAAVVFKRPPKGAGLAEHIAKGLRVTQTDVS